MEREMGGGIGMGSTCKPMAVSFQCMTKFTTNKKKREKKKEIKICIEMNENENTTQSLWDSVKAVLRVRFIAIQAYLKKQE